MLLLALAVGLALFFQYTIAPGIISNTTNNTWWWNIVGRKAGLGKYVYNSWTDGCQQYMTTTTTTTNNDLPSAAAKQCVGNTGVYRPTSIAFLFFAVAAVASKVRPRLNREAWPAKYTIYLLSVLASMIVSNDPWFNGVYVHISRGMSFIFIIVQQIILIDLAYNWNDNWVTKADTADRVIWGSGAVWLRATLSVCALLYVATFTGIGLLHYYFSGCMMNDVIIWSTALGIIGVTVVQLSGIEGSLLTSGVISVYAVYLCYSAVSKNPHGVCNPQLANENDPWGISIGLLLTSISLAWTGWSWTAEDRLRSTEGVTKARSLNHRNSHQSSGYNFRRGQDPLLDLDDPFLEHDDEDGRPPSGLALGSSHDDDGEYDEDIIFSLHSTEVWKLNATLALVSCWVSMTLTGWGSIVGDFDEIIDEVGVVGGGGGMQYHTAANPMVGRVNMIMIAISQWLALSLYAWTLVAPRLFPDRDFS